MAKLTIEYDKAVLGSGYYMKTRILPFPDTDPAGSLEESIIIQEASSIQDERILRIADPNELVALGVAPALAIFFSLDFGLHSTVGGDTLRLPMTDEWLKLGFVGTHIDFRILAPVGITGVQIDPIGAVYPIPSFYRGDFEVYDGYPATTLQFSGNNGYTRRGISGSSSTYRISEHVDMFEDIVIASNKQTSLEAEAQALIDATNIDETSYSGTDVEIYE